MTLNGLHRPDPHPELFSPLSYQLLELSRAISSPM